MELYHALNRGVDKREIFLDDQDRARFVHDMFEFNTHGSSHNVARKMSDFVSRSLEEGQKRLVDIHGWCLMGNHYHLLLSESSEGGLVQFLRKLNIGYAKYFNERYKRSGTLFQGRTKKVLIGNDAHFLHILNYIHLNPLDILENAHTWREKQINDPLRALEHLQIYRWSSYLDYAGIKNFPSILTTSLFQDVFDHRYTAQLSEYLHGIDITEIKPLVLE